MANHLSYFNIKYIQTQQTTWIWVFFSSVWGRNVSVYCVYIRILFTRNCLHNFMWLINCIETDHTEPYSPKPVLNWNIRKCRRMRQWGRICKRKSSRNDSATALQCIRILNLTQWGTRNSQMFFFIACFIITFGLYACRHLSKKQIEKNKNVATTLVVPTYNFSSFLFARHQNINQAHHFNYSPIYE